MELCKLVKEAAQHVFEKLGRGFSEATYQNALIAEVRKRYPTLTCLSETVVPVHYDGCEVGHVRQDLRIISMCQGRIDTEIVVELKAQTSISHAHVSQLMAYMRLRRSYCLTPHVKYGILINFDQNDNALKTEIENALIFRFNNNDDDSDTISLERRISCKIGAIIVKATTTSSVE